MAANGGDEVVLKDPLTEVAEGWQWVRSPDGTDAVRRSSEGLEWKMLPGGLWGTVFADSPPPLMLRDTTGASAWEVSVQFPAPPGTWGEQAGLFWYIDDNNYLKLVVECMKDGTYAVVFAKEQNCEPGVCGKIALEEDDVEDALRLRLEISADRLQASGAIVRRFYSQLVGSVNVDEPWLASAGTRVGVSAHGGQGGTGRVVTFSEFTALSVQPNRVQWDGAGGMQPPLSQGIAPADLGASPLVMADEADGPPAPGAGLTISSKLSEEERQQVTAMLLSAQAESGASQNTPWM